MNDTLDTSSAYTARCSRLPSDLAAEGYVVARMGTTSYGQVCSIENGRNSSQHLSVNIDSRYSVEDKFLPGFGMLMQS